MGVRLLHIKCLVTEGRATEGSRLIRYFSISSTALKGSIFDSVLIIQSDWVIPVMRNRKNFTGFGYGRQEITGSGPSPLGITQLSVK